MAARNVSLYGQLLEQVKEKNLLQKTPKFYVKYFTIITVFSVLTWGAVIAVGLMTEGWWQLALLPLIVIQGALTAQYGFIAHELAHQQVFENRKYNDYGALVVANLFAGLSYGFWMQKHNRHHGKPNMVGSDPDIDLRVVAFSTEQKYQKPSAERMLTRHQGWAFPMLVLFTAFDLLLDSFKSVFRKEGRGANLRFIEGAMLLVRLIFPLAFYALVLPLWAAPIAWFAYMIAFGGFMGVAFAVNHIGMPLVEKGSRIGFLERQVLTSRNITPGAVNDTFLGGLNYQVEHHLFPSMSRPMLSKVRPLVQAFCAEHSIKYTEVSFTKGFSDVISYLNEVGVSTKVDPFICPLIAEMRQTA